jgi:hypothetical protein
MFIEFIKIKHMKYKLFLTAIVGCILVASSCTKDTVTSFSNGSASSVTSSTATIAPTVADSTDTVVVFNWTNPDYATDSSTVRYTFQIDTSTSFLHPVSYSFVGTRSLSLTGEEIDSILIGYSLKFDTSYQIYLRVISSYNNYNDQKISAAVQVTMKGYLIPPKLTPPPYGNLYIIGGATAGSGWNQPVDSPTHIFARIDSVTYIGLFDLSANGAYDLLPVNGSWSSKYAVANAGLPGLSNGGSLTYYGPGAPGGSDIPGPSTAGWYVILVNFQTGVFTVTPYTGVVPTSLYIVGSATAGGWVNTPPLPSQQFAQPNSAEFNITVPLTGGGGDYKFLGQYGSWTQQWSVVNNDDPTEVNGGPFVYNGNNILAPATGTYTITVNFATGIFSVVQ